MQSALSFLEAENYAYFETHIFAIISTTRAGIERKIVCNFYRKFCKLNDFSEFHNF